MQALSSTASQLRLANVFPPDAILTNLKQRTKDGVIRELIHHLVTLGHLTPEAAESAVEMILTREKLGSTALGHGVAFPHCRTSLTGEFVGVVGIDHKGVPFDSLDGDPVHFVFLFLAPLDRREQLVGLLGKLAAIGKDKTRRLQFRGCRSAAAVHHFLTELD